MKMKNIAGIELQLEGALTKYLLITDNLRFLDLKSDKVIERAAEKVESLDSPVFESMATVVPFLEKIMNEMLSEKGQDRKAVIEANRKILGEKLASGRITSGDFKSFNYDLKSMTNMATMNSHIGKKLMFDHEIYGTSVCEIKSYVKGKGMSYGSDYQRVNIEAVSGHLVGKYDDNTLEVLFSDLYERGDKPFIRVDETEMIVRVKDAGERSRANPGDKELANMRKDLDIFYYEISHSDPIKPSSSMQQENTEIDNSVVSSVKI